MPSFLQFIISMAKRLSVQTFYFQSEEDLLMRSLQNRPLSPSQEREQQKHRVIHKKRDAPTKK